MAEPRIADCMAVASKAAHLPLAQRRQMAMFLAWERTGKTAPQIAAVIGVRDHSTVMRGIARHEERMAADAALAAETRRLMQMLEGRQ